MRRRHAFGLLLLLALGGVVLALALRGGYAIDAGDAAREAPSSLEPELRREDAPPSLVGHGAPGPSTASAARAARTRAAIRGVVHDPQGEPRARSVVLLKRWVPGDPLPDGRTTVRETTVGTRRTGGSGAFAFEDLEPGEYAVEALAPPGLLATVEQLELDEGGADLTLALGVAVAVRVRVLSEAGEAVALASVSFRGSSAMSDAHGLARLEGVDPRHRDTLVVRPTGPLALNHFGARREQWEPRDSTIELPRALAVSGRVVDGAGQPVADAAVGVLPEDAEDNWRVVEAGEDGSFSLGRLRPGPVQVRAGPPGGLFASTSRAVTVEAGRRDIELEVPRGVGLTVVITNWEEPTSAPSGPGAIRLTPGDRPGEGREFDLKADGTAEARGLEDGVEYILWARLNTMPRHFIYLTRVRASEEPLHVRMEEGGEIRVRVRCPEEVALRLVALRGPGVFKRGRLAPGEEGVLLVGVPPGVWTVAAYGASFKAPYDPRAEREI